MILSLIENNARLSLEQISGMTNLSIQQVAQKLDEYEKTGVIVGYKTLINDEKLKSQTITALIELKVTPQKGTGFDDIAKKISSFDNVSSVYLMSGGFDLSVIIIGSSMQDIARMVSSEFATIDGVISTATHFVMKKYKDQGIIFDKNNIDKREVTIGW